MVIQTIDELIKSGFLVGHMLKAHYKEGVSWKDAWTRISGRRNSLIKEARKSIYEYPVLISDSCSADIGRKVTEVVQLNNAVLTKLIFERAGLVNADEYESKEDLIQTFHGFRYLEEGLQPGTLFTNDVNDSGLNMKTVDNKVVLTEAPPDFSKMTKKEYELYLDRHRDVEDINSKIMERRKQVEANIALNKEKALGARRGTLGNTFAEINTELKQLTPTMITVNFQYKTDAGIFDGSFSVGIRAMMHIIPSDEVVKFLPKAKFDISPLIRLVQLTTGEISFIKDFIFNIDRIHKGMTQKTAGKDKWYARLKEYTMDAKMNRLFASGSMDKRQVSFYKMPTATLAISMEDVDEILRVTKGKLDLRQAAAARVIAESLSLLSFVIIDEATEAVWWLDDGNLGYAIYKIKDLDEKSKGLSEKDLLKAIIAINK